MFICRLFHVDRPFEQVEARLLAEGRLTIGRDPSADWPVEDPGATLSRFHCVLAVEDQRLVLYDTSTNGVFLAGEVRAPYDTAVPLADQARFRIGSLSVLVQAADATPMDAGATALLGPGWSGATPIAADWSEAPPRPIHRDASLIEAFCDGARLDASALSSEDPADLMRRIGAIYQQTILGLAALMADRGRIKGEHQLARTTITTSDNNPFKWAPSRKLAEDLLCGREAAFLTDSAAVRASFVDLSHHLAGMAAGARALAATATETFDPAAIESQARGGSTFLRGRTAAAWDVLVARHTRLSASAPGAAGPLQQAFAAAYAQAEAPEQPE